MLVRLVSGLLALGLVAGQDGDKQLQEAAALGLQSCVDGFVVHRDKIIRTQDSREMGAKYLTEFDVDSRLDCMRACCETPHCDVFIFEEKKPGSCYLFHCGPPHDFKCKFTSHANYSSAVLTDYNLQNAVALEEEIRRNQQEHELKSLRKSEPPSKEYNYFSNAPASTSTTPAPTPSTTTTTQAAPRGPTCSRNQFECRSGDDCIAIYNVCDGIPQCADGSDEAAELGCPVERTTLPPPPPPPPPPILASPKPYLPMLPDVLRYQQMMQQQEQHGQYPMMYPSGHGPEQPVKPGWPMGQMPLAPPEMSYAGREYAAGQLQQQTQPSGEEPIGPAAGMASHPLPVNYKLPPGYQWNGYPAPVYEPSGNKFAASAALDVMHAQNAPPPAYEQEQLPRIFNHKSPGIRLEEMEAANGVYGKEPSRVYAPYYPHVVHQSDSWQDGGGGGGGGGGVGPPAPQPPLPSPAPPHGLPSLEAHKPASTSSPGPPCDPLEKQAEAVVPSSRDKKPEIGVKPGEVQPRAKDGGRPVVQESKPMPASVVKSDIHKVQELEARLPGLLQQQQAEHAARHGPSPEEQLEMSRPRGAVISLALGLSVTAIMAVLIACRMRVVKRRGRGRGLDSYTQDADYLVNGMYL